VAKQTLTSLPSGHLCPGQPLLNPGSPLLTCEVFRHCLAVDYFHVCGPEEAEPPFFTQRALCES
jgi:hypothetical protein